MSTSDYEAYKQAKHQIAQLEAEMAEFQASSRELERELEMELEESEERHKNSQHMINTLTIELDQCKVCINKHILVAACSIQLTPLLVQVSFTTERIYSIPGFSTERNWYPTICS